MTAYNAASGILGGNMPIFVATFQFVDELGGTTSKQFPGDFADYAAANAAALLLLADIQALTTAGVTQWTLAEVFTVGQPPQAGSRVFERVSATMNLATAPKKANLAMPAPENAIFAGNTLNPANQLWIDFVDNFISGWTISDGENVNASNTTESGKRIFVRSGQTNLP